MMMKKKMIAWLSQLLLLLQVVVTSQLFAISLAQNASVPGSSKAITRLLDDLLGSPDYNSRIRPGADSGDPLEVYINININDISSISEVNMEYSMTMYLREIWKDERLMYEESNLNRSITLNYNQFDRVWTPDVFIRNLKSGTFHTITVPNRLIRLSPDGTVFFSQRLAVTLSCDMQLDDYPMDNQTCKIEFGSYAYSSLDLVFKWRLNADAVEMNSAIRLPEYVITAVTSHDCTSPKPGSFSCLRANFHLRRRLKAYMLTYYLPSFLVVLLSWLSFWIDPESAPARCSLSILTILTITTQSSGLMRSMPAGSVTKAIDVWMATCLVFVFGAFIEYSVVNTLVRRKKARCQKAASDGAKSSRKAAVAAAEEVEDGKKFIWNRCGAFRSLFDWKNDPGMAVEMASRILFPLVFFLFCLVYWPIYLVAR